MELFVNSHSTIKVMNRWNQSDLDIVLVNGDALYKTLRRQTFLSAEDLPIDFDLGKEKVIHISKEISMSYLNGVCQV